MRIPVLAGRVFSVRDDLKAMPVMIVNERFARKYFPAESPVGKHIKVELGDSTVEAPLREIVGIVGNVRRQTLTADVDAEYYLPFAQAVITAATFTIRTAGEPTSLIGALQTRLTDMDRNVPLYRVATLEDSVSNAAAQSRFQTLLLTCFAGMALGAQRTGMLYGIEPLDPLTFAAVAAILLVVSMAASCVPAYRAARLDPMQTLRDQ